MASLFPTTGIDSFTTKVDGVDYPAAAHQNDSQNAIVAVQTKVGINSSADTNSIDYKIANMWNTIYPIGCIYQSVVSTNPGTLFGGTWSALGAGRVLVGIDAGQTEFDAVEETGGSKTHTITEAELASHTHIQNAHAHTGVVNASYHIDSGLDGSWAYAGASTSTSSETATNQNTGGGTAHNNLQPYIVCYRWKRQA